MLMMEFTFRHRKHQTMMVAFEVQSVRRRTLQAMLMILGKFVYGTTGGVSQGKA